MLKGPAAQRQYEMPKLTKKTIEAIAPSSRPQYVWDDQLPGFGLKVLPSGQRRYIAKYRSGGGGRAAAQRWYVLGTHGTITPQQARALAQEVLSAVAAGQDPQAGKFSLRAAPQVVHLWERYEDDHLPRKKASSAHADRQKWGDYIAPHLGKKKILEVTRNDIDVLHKRLSDRPYQANRVIALLSKLFNLAERWGMRSDGSNPCRHVEKYPEKHRERYLSRDEMIRLGDALRDALAAGTETPYALAAIRLLLFTGARRNEVLGARWEWVDLDRRVITLMDSKTGPKILYLSHAAVAVLRELQTLCSSTACPFVIKGAADDRPLVNLSKPWQRICKRANLRDVRLHDLRHTAASIGVAQGMNLPIIGRLLGHAHPSTTHRYAHVDIDPALAAADQIGAVISSALSPRPTGLETAVRGNSK
jgi:integrase